MSDETFIAICSVYDSIKHLFPYSDDLYAYSDIINSLYDSIFETMEDLERFASYSSEIDEYVDPLNDKTHGPL